MYNLEIKDTNQLIILKSCLETRSTEAFRCLSIAPAFGLTEKDGELARQEMEYCDDLLTKIRNIMPELEYK